MPLTTYNDSRGDFTELLRQNWYEKVGFIQWNAVHSRPNTVRGFHVHTKHYDYLVCITGKMILGLRDLRVFSETFGSNLLIELEGDKMEGIVIPPGVGHGFCYLEQATHVYAVSEYWDENDELGCYWNDPSLELDWPIENPLLSDKDANAISLERLMEKLELHQKDFRL